MLQVYVAVSPTELPVDVTTPLLGLLGLRHTPIREEQAIAVSKQEKLQDPVELVELNIARRLRGGRGGWRQVYLPLNTIYFPSFKIRIHLQCYCMTRK